MFDFIDDNFPPEQRSELINALRLVYRVYVNFDDSELVQILIDQNMDHSTKKLALYRAIYNLLREVILQHHIRFLDDPTLRVVIAIVDTILAINDMEFDEVIAKNVESDQTSIEKLAWLVNFVTGIAPDEILELTEVDDVFIEMAKQFINNKTDILNTLVDGVMDKQRSVYERLKSYPGTLGYVLAEHKVALFQPVDFYALMAPEFFQQLGELHVGHYDKIAAHLKSLYIVMGENMDQLRELATHYINDPALRDRVIGNVPVFLKEVPRG